MNPIIIYFAAGTAAVILSIAAIIIMVIRRRKRLAAVADDAAADTPAEEEAAVFAEPQPAESPALAGDAIAVEELLRGLGFAARVTAFGRGHSFVRFELQPDSGERAGRIRDFAEDIGLAFAEPNLLLHIPLPGKNTIGVDIPVRGASPTIGEVLRSGVIGKNAACRFAVGTGVENNLIMSDMARAGHVLIAGGFGTGKSMALRAVIGTMTATTGKDALRLIIMGLSGLEYGQYSGMPHLLMPVISDQRTASGALGLAENEMNERYRKLCAARVSDIDSFNDIALRKGAAITPRVVIFADDIADMLGDSREAAGRLFSIIERGAKVGVHVVMTLPLPCSGALLERLAQSIPSKVCLKTPSRQTSTALLGVDSASKLRPGGEMLISLKNAPHIEHAQGIFCGN